MALSVIESLGLSIPMLQHFCHSSFLLLDHGLSVAGVLRELFDLVVESLPAIGSIAVVVGIVGGSVTIYQFWLKRANLRFLVECHGEPDPDGSVPMVLLVDNSGRRFAEDVFIQVKFRNVSFKPILGEDGEEKYSEREVEDALGSFVGYTELVSPLDERYSDTDVRMYYLDRPVYSKTVIQLTGRLAKFASEGPYEIQYSIACRSHEPREGTIKLHFNDGGVVAEASHPNLRSRLARHVPDSIREVGE